MKLARRLVLQLALLAQYIASIWPFARRAQLSSDALYGHSIQHVDCSTTVLLYLDF